MNNKSGSEMGDMKKHECEYVTDPECGKCDICEEIGEAINSQAKTIWPELLDELSHLQKLCEEQKGEIERLDCEVKRSCQFVADTNLSHAHQIGEWKKEEVLWKEREANLLSQLATQTELTKAWKKKYEEYSAYCIALVDCEKEKATQTERVRVLEVAIADIRGLHARCQQCGITSGEDECVTYQLAEQALNQEDLK